MFLGLRRLPWVMSEVMVKTVALAASFYAVTNGMRTLQRNFDSFLEALMIDNNGESKLAVEKCGEMRVVRENDEVKFRSGGK